MKKNLSICAMCLAVAISFSACSSTIELDSEDTDSTDALSTEASDDSDDPLTVSTFEWDLQTYDGYTADGSTQLPDISDANGLLWYQFEEGVGASVLKSSLGTGRDSIRVNATLLSDGGLEGSGAIYFDGVDDSVKLNNDFQSVSQITSNTFLHPSFQTISVAFSFSPESLEGKQLLYEQGDQNNGLAIGISEGKLIAAIGAGESATGVGTATIVGEIELSSDQIGQWIQVALTYNGSLNGGTALLYLDGVVVSTANQIGSVIPQTLDAAGIGGAVWGDNVLGFVNSFYKGKMDDLRIYSTVIEPIGELEDQAVYLQSAYLKNYYISEDTDQIACRSMVDPSTRGWIPTVGLTDENGISFRLTGSNQFLAVQNQKLTLVTLSTESSEEDKQAATFFYEAAPSVPSWGEGEESYFFRFYNYDRSLMLKSSKSGTLSLTEATSVEDSNLLTVFKATGDQTKVQTGLKGAVYYPSYALNAPQFWKWYDHAIIDRDMQYATEILGVNAFRIWVSYEYWLEDAAHFEAGFNDFLELADKWGITIMVSLFEGCGDSYDYSSYSTWNRSYTSTSSRKTAGWAITSPSAEIYNNRSRWDEPKQFVKWFMDLYKNDQRLNSIEIYNEPWGDSRTALALELCDYAVSMQGSVALTLGTAPYGGHSLSAAVEHGMDLLQYHDNFPNSAAEFETNAKSKIATAKLANLPIVCTEVQWVGGPSGINYPVYSNLAPTCEKLMENGDWAPYYWTLMVHPCYLNSYRDNYKMYNGLLNEDGTVNNIKNAKAVAGRDLSVSVNLVNPYEDGSYHYRTTFSDDFFDLHGYKWSGGNYSAETGAYVGSGVSVANQTDFADFKAEIDVTLSSGEAGLLIRSDDGANGYLLVCDRTDEVLKIYKLTNGEKTELATSSKLSISGENVSLTLTVQAVGDSLTIECACGSLTVTDSSYSTGLVGVYADTLASFDNLLVQKNG